MFRFTVHPDGGDKFEVVARSRAITAWETAPGQPKGTQRSVSDITSNLKMRDMVDLAWFAADRAGQTGMDLHEWRERVDVDLERYDDDEDEAGPTQSAP